jgi:hypothetical protein
MSRLKSLLGLKSNIVRNPDIESEDAELIRVHNVVIEFLGSKFLPKELSQVVEARRRRALARVVGLTNLSQMLKTALQKQQSKSKDLLPLH